ASETVSCTERLTLGEISPVALDGLDVAQADTEALAIIDAVLTAPDPADRYTAIEALAFLPWREAHDRLVKAAEDSDEQVKMYALTMVSRHGDKLDQPLLQRFLDWGDFWIPNDKHKFAIRPRNSFDADNLPQETLARLKDPALEPVIRQLLGKPDEVTDVNIGLRLAERYGVDKFVKEIANIFSIAPQASLRAQAAKTLLKGGVNAKQTEQYLKSALHDSDQPQDMLGAVVAIGYARDAKRKDWEKQLRSLVVANDPTVRGQALEALGLMGLPTSDEEISNVVLDPLSRGRVLPKFHEWAPASALTILEQAAAQEEDDHLLVLLAMTRMGSATAFETLSHYTTEKETDGSVSPEAIAAFNALAELQDKKIVPLMTGCLNDDKSPLRQQYAALQALGRLQDPATMPSLVRFMRAFRVAQPGLAAYAAGIVYSLKHPGDTALPPGERLIWPPIRLGRYTALDTKKKAGSGPAGALMGGTAQ
ncbi:MAG: HEAT repeat domain-containing protein, partial [bacterium]